jgi:hypothetical protein
LDGHALLYVWRAWSKFAESSCQRPKFSNHPSHCNGADPVKIAPYVIGQIDHSFATREAKGEPSFENIILIGHSIGGLIARKVYLLAGPESREARFEDSPPESPLALPSPWFKKIRRIILFAGMNRGWSISQHLNLSRAVSMYAGLVFAELFRLFTGKQFTILHVRRGARFITELRLQWIALAKLRPTFDPPTTIQLLGTVDDLVAPSDNIDLVTGRDFIYLDVPFSGHENVVCMDQSPPGQERRRIFVEALTQDPVTLATRNLVPNDFGLLEARQKVTDVIFVIHGIRDVGHWTQTIARRVEALGNAPPRIYASETRGRGESHSFLVIVIFDPETKIYSGRVMWTNIRRLSASTRPTAVVGTDWLSRSTRLFAAVDLQSDERAN